MSTQLQTKLLQQLSIGFDNIFDELDKRKTQNFPKHNIYKKEHNKYFVEIALAGYKKDEVNVSLSDNLLTIKGEIKDTLDEENQKEYMCKNIAKRNFTLDLRLNRTLKVIGASMVDGMLTISLEEEKEEVKNIQIDFS